MPSTYTTRNRLEKQNPGENTDTWGSRLNGNTIDMADQAMDGVVSFSLSGSLTLTTANGSSDQARCRTINITGGSGGTVTIPNAEKYYMLKNGSSGTVTVTTGSGTSAAVKSGNTCAVICDGSNACYAAQVNDFGSSNVVTTGTLASGALAVTGAITATTNITATGNLTCNGTASLGDAIGDVHVIKGKITHTSNDVNTFDTTQPTGNVFLFNASASASFAGTVVCASSDRPGNSAYKLLTCVSGGPDIEMSVSGVGAVASDGGTAMTTPADYADMMEWADGNPDGEDRIGYSVVVENGGVRKATAADKRANIIGIASGNPSVCGGSGWNRWVGKFVTDDFNRQIMEDYQVVVWTETVLVREGVSGRDATEEEPAVEAVPPKYEDVERAYVMDELPDGVTIPAGATYLTQQRRMLSPNFDPEAPYTPRAARPEWDPIGLVGRIPLRRGCPTNPRWIKLKDISPTVEEWLVR